MKDTDTATAPLTGKVIAVGDLQLTGEPVTPGILVECSREALAASGALLYRQVTVNNDTTPETPTDGQDGGVQKDWDDMEGFTYEAKAIAMLNAALRLEQENVYLASQLDVMTRTNAGHNMDPKIIEQAHQPGYFPDHNLSTTPTGWVCHECRDGRCDHCVGIPCHCECPLPETPTAGQARIYTTDELRKLQLANVTQEQYDTLASQLAQAQGEIAALRAIADIAPELLTSALIMVDHDATEDDHFNFHRTAERMREALAKQQMKGESDCEPETPPAGKDGESPKQHSPLPWIQGTRGPNGCPIIGTAKGTMVCMLAHSTREPDQAAEAEANVELILAAVNERDALASQLAQAQAEQGRLAVMVEEVRVMGHEWFNTAAKREQQLAQAQEALEAYEDALKEAEAILGMDYADFHNPLFQMVCKARELGGKQ